MLRSIGEITPIGRRDFENFNGGRSLKVALMGEALSLLQTALQARPVAPRTDSEDEDDDDSIASESKDTASTPSRKRPAAATSSVSSKKKPPPTKTPPPTTGHHSNHE